MEGTGDTGMRALAYLARVIELALGDIGLSLAQYRLLAYLSRGSSAASPAARQLATSRPSVTALVDGVVAKGLVTRVPDAADRRRITLALTPEGFAVVERAEAAAAARLSAARGPSAARGRPARGSTRWACGWSAPPRRGVGGGVAMSLDERLDGARKLPPVGAYEFDSVTDPGGFEPVTTRLRYRPPRRTINPDPSLGWIRRATPIVYSHWVSFSMALSMALVGIVTRVMIPRWVGYAINEALVRPKATRVPLSHFVIVLGVLTAVGFVSGSISRYFLFRSAYALDYDLRVLMYRHLSRMSFSFYDRVESGQLISRANSDIRSVQMFLAFGPYFMVQFAMFALAVFYMLQINVLLTLLALVTIPFVYRIGVTMRRWMFPLSWLTMARTADVATIVDENINGVRVVKSFAGEKEQIGKLAESAAAPPVGGGEDDVGPGPLRAIDGEPDPFRGGVDHPLRRDPGHRP